MSGELSLGDLKNVSLMIGTPMYGSLCYGTYLNSILSLIKLCNILGIQMGVSSICNESLLQRSRNYVVDEFLRSGFSHLLFIDTDIQFNPQDVITLLMLNRDVVGAPYPEKRRIYWPQIMQVLKSDSTIDSDKLKDISGNISMDSGFAPQDMLEVDVLKPGFMMVKRQVFDRIRLVYPENFYKPDHIGIQHFDGVRNIQMYFSVEIDPETRKLTTEYEYFCKLWRNIGGRIHLCPWIVLTHFGMNNY